MLGRPNCAVPVLANSLAGAWLKTSVATDLTNVRSSTTSARCGKQLRDPGARLAVPRELADRPQQLGMLLGEDVHEREPAPLDERVRDRLAAVLLELGLVVEQLELAGPAGHEQVDDALAPAPGNAPAGPPADHRRARIAAGARIATVGVAPGRPAPGGRRRAARPGPSPPARRRSRRRSAGASGRADAVRAFSRVEVAGHGRSTSRYRSSTDSLAGHELVEVQQHASDGRSTPEAPSAAVASGALARSRS